MLDTLLALLITWAVLGPLLAYDLGRKRLTTDLLRVEKRGKRSKIRSSAYSRVRKVDRSGRVVR